MRAGAIAIVMLAACAPAAREGASAIVVGDAGAPRLGITDAGSAPREPSPFELALSETLACVRMRGHVHCTRDMNDGRAIAAEPPLTGIEDAISVSLGVDFGCAVTFAGKVLCFGKNDVGQLGAGLRAEKSDAPLVVLGVSEAVRVVAGRSHACALLRDGSMRCWGDNRSGQTGSRTSYTPAARELVEAEPVPSVKDAIAIATGGASTCALTSTHDVWCFGDVSAERPKDFSGPPGPSAPRKLAALSGFDDITATGANAYCGIRDEGVFCWGETYPLLLREPSDDVHAMRVPHARAVRAGSAHACALLLDGRVSCWGPDAPGIVAGLAPAVELVAGGTTTCTLASRQPTTAQCWGKLPRSGATGQETTAPVTIRLTE